LRLVFVPAVAERIEAGAGAAEADHDQEERGERVEPEMRAGPGQAQRQRDGRRPGSEREQREQQRHRRNGEAAAVDDAPSGWPLRDEPAGDAESEQQHDADERECDHVRRDLRWRGGGAAFVSRTPRPPCALAAPSAISSMPAFCSAPTSFISESTLPRTTPSLASMRWMVGRDRLDNSASVLWSIRSIARAARICEDVIIHQVWIIISDIS
jgi:hypothetical protein